MGNEHQINSPIENAENQPKQTSQTGASAYAFKPWKSEVPNSFPILGEIKDIENTKWDVREIRPTKHGFDMHYGIRTLYRGANPSRKPSLIATLDLMEFWHSNGTRRDGTLFDLPENRDVLKSMRACFGFNCHDDTNAFWNDRIDDLRSLSAEEFAAKHNVSRGAATGRRYRIFGSSKRPRGWWRQREVMAILLSDQTLRKIGSKLGISICHAFQLRARAKQELLEENNRVNTKLVSFLTFPETAQEGDYEPPIAA